MSRFTHTGCEPNSYVVEPSLLTSSQQGISGAAIHKLGRLEDLCDELLKQQQQIAQKLEQLRQQDKTKSYQFKEMMALKLTNNNMLTFLARYDLLDEEAAEPL